MENVLALEFVRVTEAGALAAARWMGQGDNDRADQAAVEAMRRTMDEVPIHGTIVIGEGERDEAPMLYIGEHVGMRDDQSTPVDIAVDPLEGTNLVARGQPNAIAVLAVAEAGGLMHAPDIYMEKLCVGPWAAGKVDIDLPIRANLHIIASSLNRDIRDITVAVLDRPRHAEIIDQVRRAGARIKLIPDGDLSAAISAAVRGTNVHAVIGTGGAPEGVLTAAALRCLGGEIQGRFKPRNDAERERAAAMLCISPDEVDRRVYSTQELAKGENIIFAATGVTNGDLFQGVRYFGGGARTHSLVMMLTSKAVRFVDTIHMEDTKAMNGVRLA